LVNGIVRRYERGDLIVDLGLSEGLLPHREQVPRENYRQGDRARVYISEVKMSTKGPQIILSRSHPGLVAALFHFEVPEIAEGIVEIKAVAREAGSRTKIAVASYDSDVDPVGACVGMRGSRVQNVVSELRGEKIDIIPWTPDVARFVCSALAPADVTRIYVDNEDQSLEVIVPDDQLSLAIGKKGQNVRLAAKLTGWKIDIKSETRAAEAAMEEFSAEKSEVKAAGDSTSAAVEENEREEPADNGTAESELQEEISAPAEEEEVALSDAPGGSSEEDRLAEEKDQD
jgi:N utilization substance protein A